MIPRKARIRATISQGMIPQRNRRILVLESDLFIFFSTLLVGIVPLNRDRLDYAEFLEYEEKEYWSFRTLGFTDCHEKLKQICNSSVLPVFNLLDPLSGKNR
jgi:hypothetical protein